MSKKKKMEEEVKREPGRPVEKVYDQNFRNVCGLLAGELGYTVEQIAGATGVSFARLQRWMKAYPELGESIREGRWMFDTALVESSLLKRALGFTYTEKCVKVGPKGTVTEDSTKYALPDTQACRLWLLNRRPELWRAREEITVHADDLAQKLIQARNRVPALAEKVEETKEVKTKSKKLNGKPKDQRSLDERLAEAREKLRLMHEAELKEKRGDK